MSDAKLKKSILCSEENSSLLIIDIQTKLTAVMPMNVLARMKRNTMLLIKSANFLSIPVYVSEQYPKGLGKLEPEITEILSDEAVIFEKTCFSCAGSKEFMDKLENSGRKQIILIGMEAHICVLQTAIELQVAGYEVFVAIDGVCSRNRESYENALQRIRQSGIITATSESIIFEWLKDANHDQFKNISKLIK